MYAALSTGRQSLVDFVESNDRRAQFVCFLKEYTIERGKTTWLEGFKTILSVNLEFTLSTKFY